MMVFAFGFGQTLYSQLPADAVAEIQFCDRKYEYKAGKDSISLFFNVLDSYGNRVKNASIEDIRNSLTMEEDNFTIPQDRVTIEAVSYKQRIPASYTFSVLVDLSIPVQGKEQIYGAIYQLVENAPDSCVYLSFFGEEVSPSVVVTKENYRGMREKFLTHSDGKVFYSALYAKLTEFSSVKGEYEDSAKVQMGYRKVPEIAQRAVSNRDKNILIIFTEGTSRPDDEAISFVEVTDYQSVLSHVVPKVTALYYTEHGEDPDIEMTLKGVCEPKDVAGRTLADRKGRYLPSGNIGEVLRGFREVVDDASYDFSFTYRVPESKVYSKTVTYSALWNGKMCGKGEYSIGTAERPWPIRAEGAADTLLKLFYAVLVTLLVIVLFFFAAKVVVPFWKSKEFEWRYYKKYVPEHNVKRRICHYCCQDILPGEYVVKKCNHVMHVHCWQQNGYKCSEYGQNCNTGIQEHVEWSELLSLKSFRDCYQSISGIVAGFVSWVIYELCGHGIFDSLAYRMVGLFLSADGQQGSLIPDCASKTSAFLTIGLLLGFFLSFIFRYNDEYRKKDMKVYVKIFLLSLLTGIIGMASFAIGASILCLLLSVIGTTYIPWYCSLPGYLMFSICVSLALTIKSTIPVKSAMMGGVCSALIGFVVLYCTSQMSDQNGWVSMLLNFVIYGGGLGVSLVTVRMIAEKYFLDIQNGVKAGTRIPIHKWMNATGGGNKVSIGMTRDCEIQMNWEKSNKVAKEHAQLFIDHGKHLPVLKPMARGVIFNSRVELPVSGLTVLSNGDMFKIGDTIFQYVETN